MDDCEALRRLLGLWAMIQQTARPESAAPMVKAETADATSRLRETKLSGSMSKLCCRIPEKIKTHNRENGTGTQMETEMYSFWFTIYHLVVMY